MTQPVIVRIRRAKAAVHGALCAAIALVGLALSLLLLHTTTPNIWLIFLSLSATLMLGGFALLFGGIALRAPVALRMDHNGISGFYCDPATWDEIKDVGLVTGNKGHRFLGFTLHDPIGFRDRQSPWRRATSWASGRNSGHHIIVPELLLQDTSVDDLIARAQQLRHEQPHRTIM